MFDIGEEVEFPSGKGVVVVNTPDSEGIIIIESTEEESKGQYKRVAKKCVNPLPSQAKLRENLVKVLKEEIFRGGWDGIADALISGDIDIGQYRR